jgi:hypothetical protein
MDFIIVTVHTVITNYLYSWLGRRNFTGWVSNKKFTFRILSPVPTLTLCTVSGLCLLTTIIKHTVNFSGNAGGFRGGGPEDGEREATHIDGSTGLIGVCRPGVRISY